MKDDQSSSVLTRLTELGGTAEAHAVTDEAIGEVEAAAPAEAEAPDAYSLVGGFAEERTKAPRPSRPHSLLRARRRLCCGR